ncbi:Bax inhibitor-1/YccA family protein [Hydrogenophaga sp. PAMC20947]|uniref:Bax inhibitor-1/YccA family protein n=1 Tax=Hydrogenophaga sp. PAMC20947 TaxID=2565558 RepID=UPI00109E3161|nr:Bax inhibitor-1/YccA family protein [Hydrogenophaga sp. PAMC20947]QCB47473.1 Bax inhibitor-1/YccA family protein [Hydrogenophaga sp. PAMC20947]
MNPSDKTRTLPSSRAPWGTGGQRSLSTDNPAAAKVLRNTYALLSLTLLFSAGVAATGVAFGWTSPGLVVTLVGYFGLLFAVHKLQNSGWAIPAVFALTGFMGYTLGPMLTATLALPGGAQTIVTALGATGATFLALSAYVLTTRKDFSFMGGFLFAGMVVALMLGLGAIFFEMPALGLAVSGLVALLSVGLILFETSRIVNGGETNYVLATVGLFVSVFNLFVSLLNLMGIGSND